MKKLIYLVMVVVLLSSYVTAQTTAAYFTVSTKGQVTAWNQDGYEFGTTTATAPGDSAYYILSHNIGETSATSGARNGFMGSKILLGVNITIAFEDVVATLVTQISFDGTTYYDFATTDADLTPNVTGVQAYLVDFTSVYAPFVRLKFNASGLDIGTTGRVKFLYALPL